MALVLISVPYTHTHTHTNKVISEWIKDTNLKLETLKLNRLFSEDKLHITNQYYNEKCLTLRLNM